MKFGLSSHRTSSQDGGQNSSTNTATAHISKLEIRKSSSSSDPDNGVIGAESTYDPNASVRLSFSGKSICPFLRQLKLNSLQVQVSKSLGSYLTARP